MEKAGIVAFAFGMPSTISSNQHILEIASRVALSKNVPVYTQPDVGIFSPLVDVTYIQERPNKPSPTLRIARMAVQWAIERQMHLLWIVAAKPHLWRAERDMREAVREARADIAIGWCEDIDKFPERVWFCPESMQKRVRSRREWDKRENLLMRMPFFIYKRIAG